MNSTRQICKRLTTKMKLKNQLNRKQKINNKNNNHQIINKINNTQIINKQNNHQVISKHKQILKKQKLTKIHKQLQEQLQQQNELNINTNNNQQLQQNESSEFIKQKNQANQSQQQQEFQLNQLSQSQLLQEVEQNQLSQSQLIPLNQNEQPNQIGQQKPAWYFAQKKFTQFELSEPTQKALLHYNYKQMTHIQSRSLPYLLKGRDVLGAAKTGSGKTLAYLIPCVQLLYRFQFKQKNGTGVIIITPTRQLAIQVFQVAKKLCQFHNKTIGLLMGGMNRKTQSNKLQKGVNLLICTPGRLLDHLQNSKFNYRNLLSLVIDQADALLRQGFQQQLNNILKVLPKQRQTILFSATQTQKVDQLAKLSLRDPIYIGVDDDKKNATVQNLQQGFVLISADKKFQLLFTFLQKQKDKKIMVFFSSCNSVKFFSDLLNYVDISVMDIHGKQKQQKRSTTFFEFSQMKTGVLLCTDVAARGLDIPQVDWIIQYDPPLDIKQYIHRVGRTARGHIKKGRALLFLLQQQQGYLKHLVQSKVQLNHYQFSDDKLMKIQDQYLTLIQKNHYLYKDAVCAFKSYLHAYTTYSLKDIFNVHNLDLNKVGKGFGLKKIPHVQLNVKLGGSKVKKINKMAQNNNYHTAKRNF